MKRLRHSFLWLILPSAAVFVFATLLLLSLYRMFDVQDAMRTDAEQNMLWVLHQSQVAALRLIETVAMAELGEAGPEELALRRDLLIGRFNLLNDGPQRRFIEQIGYGEDLDQLAATLTANAPMIDNFTPGEGSFNNICENLSMLSQIF